MRFLYEISEHRCPSLRQKIQGPLVILFTLVNVLSVTDVLLFFTIPILSVSITSSSYYSCYLCSSTRAAKGKETVGTTSLRGVKQGVSGWEYDKAIKERSKKVDRQLTRSHTILMKEYIRCRQSLY